MLCCDVVGVWCCDCVVLCCRVCWWVVCCVRCSGVTFVTIFSMCCVGAGVCACFVDLIVGVRLWFVCCWCVAFMLLRVLLSWCV